MTADEQVKKVAKAIAMEIWEEWPEGAGAREICNNAAQAAIAAMKPGPVTNECAVRASELDTFVRFAKRLYPSSFVPRAVTIADLEEYAARHRRGTCDHPTLAPQAEVRACGAVWVCPEAEWSNNAYAGTWTCALPARHGGPHVELTQGIRWHEKGRRSDAIGEFYPPNTILDEYEAKS